MGNKCYTNIDILTTIFIWKKLSYQIWLELKESYKDLGKKEINGMDK